MGRINNNREAKLDEKIPHNRKPGRGKFWKQTANRRSRRTGNRISRKVVDDFKRR